MGTPSVCLELRNHQNRKENTMAQVILNLELDEILRAFTTGAKNEGLRLLLQKGLNAMLDRESSEQPGATRYKRTEERTDSRNGVRTRELKTRIHIFTWMEYGLSPPGEEQLRMYPFLWLSASIKKVIVKCPELLKEAAKTRKAGSTSAAILRNGDSGAQSLSYLTKVWVF